MTFTLRLAQAETPALLAFSRFVTLQVRNCGQSFDGRLQGNLGLSCAYLCLFSFARGQAVMAARLPSKVVAAIGGK
jgi:hypothetical protein